MSVSQPMSDSPPYNNVRLFARYGWMLIHQVGVWLSLVFLLADIATAVAKDSLSFLPDWLDSSPEFAPWVLWFGIVIGGFRILRDERKHCSAQLADFRSRLATYESSRPNVTVGLIGRNGVTDHHDVAIRRVELGPEFDKQQLRSSLMQRYADMTVKFN